ncbi:MAG: hypothetical protein CR986_01460 [Ignavibacteriae bacterium]|nr:MAG: hypothetical protein CR986_01460 [Ignavibacteriota bacterium]
MIGQAKRLYELQSLFRSNKKENSNSSIISITSGKGGTGKSFFAGNIAYALAEKGLKILLVDFDINMANQSVLYNIAQKLNLYHYFTYNKSLNDIVFEYNKNLHLILGESGRFDHPKLDEQKIKFFITELRSLKNNYDLILLDTASGIDKSTIEILLNSDEIILVTTPEPTSVMDAYAIFKLIKNYGSDVKTDVLVNKCFSEEEGIEAYNNLEKAAKHFLKSKLNHLGNLKFSEKVIQSIKRQKLLIANQKNEEISMKLQEISDKLKIHTIG